jgi:hypothetical protein
MAQFLVATQYVADYTVYQKCMSHHIRVRKLMKCTNVEFEILVRHFGAFDRQTREHLMWICQERNGFDKFSKIEMQLYISSGFSEFLDTKYIAEQILCS